MSDRPSVLSRIVKALTFMRVAPSLSMFFGPVMEGFTGAWQRNVVLDGDQTGKMVNRNWHDYKVPTMLDVPPEVVVLPIEKGDEAFSSTGVKGLGEPCTIPTAAAVANAIAHAIGVRVTDSPINTIALCRALAERKKEA